MRFLSRAFCQILFFHGALQCFQARLEFSDQGFGDNDNAYRELNDDVNTDFMRTSPDNEGKDTSRKELEAEDEIIANEKEASNFYEDSEERSAGQFRQENAEERGISKRERKNKKHLNELQHQNRDSEILETPSETEHANRDHETAHFYLTKPSDIANMSAMLGPGPIPIPIYNPTTQKPNTFSPIAVNSSINLTNTKLGSTNINNAVANMSLKSDNIVSFVGERKRGHKRKLKLHNDREINEEVITINPHKKESGMFHRQHSKYEPRQGEGRNTNAKTVHTKIKNKKIPNEAVNTRKDVEKYRLNDEEQYTNLSVINKSFLKTAGKKFKLRGNYPTEGESELDGEEKRMDFDQINDKDARKISLLNAELGVNEEEHSSLRDEPAEQDKENGNLHKQSNPRKGIRSKIEHGDWVDQVTLFPLPDYSVRRNKTHNKNKLSLTEILKKPPKDDFSANEKKHTSNKKHKRTKSVNLENVASLVETSEQDVFETDKGGYISSKEATYPHHTRMFGKVRKEQIDTRKETGKNPLNKPQNPEKPPKENFSNTLLGNDKETENKRDERDTKRRAERNNFDKPVERSIFNRHADTVDENGGEMYDMDMNHDDQSNSDTNRNENANRKQEVSEKSEDDYEYDSQLVEDEKSNTEVCVENRTLLTTRSTFASTTDIVQSMKPTKKANKPKTTFNRNNNPQETGGVGIGVWQVNDTVDPYEMFLCGQLADDFVAEVLKKVKRSRKISRELGYSNETEETCDRCIELKPIKVPELAVTRNSLGKCLKSSKPVQNCSMCCRVPKPLLRYLNTLVYFEQENENNFYNKIQDDSSFILTGDYAESLSKGEKVVKINEKPEDEKSSFNKDTFDGQRLREDVNEEKSEDKGANSDSFKNNEEKSSTLLQNSAKDAISEHENLRKSKESQGEVKRNLGKFIKSKIIREKERNFPDIDENLKENHFETILNLRNSAPSVKEYISSKEATYPHHTRLFGKVRKDYPNVRKEAVKNPLNTPPKPEKLPIENFDRYYGKSNYDYFKQYPSKISPQNSRTGYKLNNENSMLTNPPLKVDRDRDGYYNIKNSNAMSKTGFEKYNFRDNYYGYPPKECSEEKRLNHNGNYKGYQSKYDSLYENNGEYSLYPNLESINPVEDANGMLGNYKINEGGNPRMVKRDAEALPMYDDEPNVFFEIPNIEYDLYK